MRWCRASHLFVERIFSRVAPGGSHFPEMRSSNGGWHGVAGWGFRGFPETGAGLRADDGANSVSHARPSIAAANLRLAELRSLPEISGIVQVLVVLATIVGRSAIFGPD